MATRWRWDGSARSAPASARPDDSAQQLQDLLELLFFETFGRFLLGFGRFPDGGRADRVCGVGAGGGLDPPAIRLLAFGSQLTLGDRGGDFESRALAVGRAAAADGSRGLLGALRVGRLAAFAAGGDDDNGVDAAGSCWAFRTGFALRAGLTFRAGFALRAHFALGPDGSFGARFALGARSSFGTWGSFRSGFTLGTWGAFGSGFALRADRALRSSGAFRADRSGRPGRTFKAARTGFSGWARRSGLPG